MHGSSSVPQELQDLINAYGGAIPQTFGVPVEEIVRGIKSGVRKVNVDTDCRMAITGAIRKLFAEQPKEFDPRKYLKPAIEEMQKFAKPAILLSVRPDTPIRSKRFRWRKWPRSMRPASCNRL